MGWQWTVYGGGPYLAALVMLGALVVVWPRRKVAGGRPLVGILIAMMVWSIGAGSESMVVGQNAKIVFGVLSYPGAVSVAVFFFLFTIEYTQSERWAPSPQWLLFIPAFCVLAAATNSFHHELWTGFTMEAGNTFGLLPRPDLLPRHRLQLPDADRWRARDDRGLLRHDANYRGQFLAVLVFASLPFVGSLAYVIGFSPFPDQDPP